MVNQLSYCRDNSFPPIIQHEIWLYLRFTLSYLDVGRSYWPSAAWRFPHETVRRWVLKFGPGWHCHVKAS